MASGERVRLRGISIYRPIIYGNSAVLLTPDERQHVPPEHTHRWTVAVRSAASALNSDIIGGADDISHFIKRVTFKLHDTYANPTRNIDKPPFELTETGWGEFEIQIRITFVPEAGEKAFPFYHHLKLHPWSVTPLDGSDVAPPESAQTAPVHAWQYDEVVFSDPFQNFMNILLKHPPTPLPNMKKRPTPFSTLNPKTIVETGLGTPEFTQEMITQEAERLEEAKKKVLAEHEKWKKLLTEKDALLTTLKEQTK